MKEKILQLLDIHQKEPYKPIWGEIFYLLYQIKRAADKNNKVVSLYQVKGRDLVYIPHKKRFYLDANDIKFHLTIDQLATCILERRFFPSDDIDYEIENMT